VLTSELELIQNQKPSFKLVNIVFFTELTHLLFISHKQLQIMKQSNLRADITYTSIDIS